LHKLHLLAFILFASHFHLPQFLKLFTKIQKYFLFAFFLFACFTIMASSLLITITPENEALNFKQRGGENLKDTWYRICDAKNRSTRKQSTIVLLQKNYVGITTWYRFVLDTITGGNFLMCSTLDAFNAMGNLVGSPPIIINETALTLEHVMQRLEAIENKMPTIEHLENVDKKVRNHITQFGSKVGIALKTLKEKEPIINERIEQSPARID
jgi:hypothetical protein